MPHLVNEPAVERQWLQDATERLADLLGAPAQVLHEPKAGSDSRIDMVAAVGSDVFAVDLQRSTTSASIAGAVRRALQNRELLPEAVALLVVPFMTAAGRELAQKSGVSWLDLSGNAHIRASRALINIQGQPNRFKQRGRPPTPFAPKASRLARWFLMHPGATIAQHALAAETGVDPAQVSRTVRTLLDQSLLERTRSGELSAPDLDLLLDAWRAEYDFEKHSIVAGHVPGRSGPETLQRLAEALESRGVRYAATGLAGAWLLTRFASFRLVTLLVRDPLPGQLLDQIGFRDEPRGANVWLATPNDDGVFAGARDCEGTTCAHPVQVYLDLTAQPERANEAAAELRRQLWDDAG